MSKKIGNIMLILLLAASFVACSDDKNESKLEVKEAVAVEMVSDNVESSDKVLQKEQPEELPEALPEEQPEELPEALPEEQPEVQPEEKPSGIHEDGMGYDPDYGEGIGEVIALSDEEKSYVLTQTTNTWLEMEKTEKDELVVLIGRWLE